MASKETSGICIREPGNCEGCRKVLKTQAHMMDCAEFSDIREGLDMSKDSDMVKFFKGVLERRRENESGE